MNIKKIIKDHFKDIKDFSAWAGFSDKSGYRYTGKNYKPDKKTKKYFEMLNIAAPVMLNPEVNKVVKWKTGPPVNDGSYIAICLKESRATTIIIKSKLNKITDEKGNHINNYSVLFHEDVDNFYPDSIK